MYLQCRYCDKYYYTYKELETHIINALLIDVKHECLYFYEMLNTKNNYSIKDSKLIKFMKNFRNYYGN